MNVNLKSGHKTREEVYACLNILRNCDQLSLKSSINYNCILMYLVFCLMFSLVVYSKNACLFVPVTQLGGRSRSGISQEWAQLRSRTKVLKCKRPLVNEVQECSRSMPGLTRIYERFKQLQTSQILLLICKTIMIESCLNLCLHWFTRDIARVDPS